MFPTTFLLGLRVCPEKKYGIVLVLLTGQSSRSNLFFVHRATLSTFYSSFKTTPATSRALLCQPLNISYIRRINIVVYTMVVYHPNNVPIEKS
jgi:hypothetical protein